MSLGVWDDLLAGCDSVICCDSVIFMFTHMFMLIFMLMVMLCSCSCAISCLSIPYSITLFFCQLKKPDWNLAQQLKPINLNKVRYTATPVACGWAGEAPVKVTKEFGQWQ